MWMLAGLLALSMPALGSVNPLQLGFLRAAPKNSVPPHKNWKNEPFLQGRGPGWAALATPWRARMMRGRGVPQHLLVPIPRPLYISDPGTQKAGALPGELVHDDVWGSVYNPGRHKPGAAHRTLCVLADGPGCFRLQVRADQPPPTSQCGQSTHTHANPRPPI